LLFGVIYAIWCRQSSNEGRAYMLKTLKSKNMSKEKNRATVTLTKENYDYIQSQIKTQRFKDITHAVNYAIYQVRQQEEKGKPQKT
jgi:hypothetical protein